MAGLFRFQPEWSLVPAPKWLILPVFLYFGPIRRLEEPLPRLPSRGFEASWGIVERFRGVLEGTGP